MKPIDFRRTSLDDLRAFPRAVQQEVGLQLSRVQRGLEPVNWKPMSDVGPGGFEVRVQNKAGIFRAIYTAAQPEVVYVLHVFLKKAHRTAKRDIDLAEARFRELKPHRPMTETDGIPGQVFASVWDALEDSPAEAANMRLRSDLMIAIQEAVSELGLTQTKAARRLEVTQPRLNDLLRGRIDNFSLDALILLASRAGLTVHMQVEPTPP